MGPDGTMSLYDHLRELRYRLIVSVAAIGVGMLICAFFWQHLYELLLNPYTQAQHILGAQHNVQTTAVNNDVVGPFMLTLRIVLVSGIIVSCPVWLYQIWAYIVPALHPNEKKNATIFLVAAVPLFLTGIAIAYWILPHGIAIMLKFTPSSVPVLNLVDITRFLNLMIITMAVFGTAFLLPVFVVLLNRIGLLRYQTLAKARRFTIFGIFCIAAFGAPTGDPITMLAMALPLTGLYLIAEFVAKLHDARNPQVTA